MEASMALFSDVLKIDPENVRAHNNLGIALAKQGKFDEAINHFSEALRVDPTSAFARKNLDQALRNRDR
jgi:superkiller protein 3